MTKKKLCAAKEIWDGKINDLDLQEAIWYATVSLPWTFNRMGYRPQKQTSSNKRLLHIVLGVVNQSILERTLKKNGFSCKFDWSNYSLSDVFDFNISGKVYDVKTFVVYSEYDKANNREEFSTELLIKNKGYSGPKWKNFFPMMVPITQLNIEKMKDSYIFGIATTRNDLRKIPPVKEDKGFWCAAPFDKARTFCQDKKLIIAREKESKGFSLVVKWKRSQQLLNDSGDNEVEITFFGEWNNKPKNSSLRISPGEKKSIDELFSSLSCIRLKHPISLTIHDEVIISVKNYLKDVITKPANPTININDDKFTWIVGKDSFVNLRLVEDYRVFWLGYIPFKEFAATFSSYPSYFIFNPKNPDENVPGQITPKIRERLETFDKRRIKAIEKNIKPPWPEFIPFIKGKSIKTGFLISAQKKDGKVIGASTYVYPPYALQESAFYVLAKDLYTMDSLRYDSYD